MELIEAVGAKFFYTVFASKTFACAWYCIQFFAFSEVFFRYCNTTALYKSIIVSIRISRWQTDEWLFSCFAKEMLLERYASFDLLSDCRVRIFSLKETFNAF